MKKLVLIAIFFAAIVAKAQTFDAGGNGPAVAMAAPDKFTYLGKPVANYGLGWYSEAVNIPPYMYMSGFAGIKFFTWTEARMIIDGGGNVGIGTLNPDQKLTIKGGGIGFDYNSADKKLYSPQDGELEWMTNQGAGYHGFAVSHQGEKRVYLNVLGDSYINGGNLGIGTTSPKEKLSVNGNIRSKEIKVEATNWPDYVFEEGYKVGTLKGLESYIKANKHLPEIPTAKQVGANGIALGEMNKLLLKKIEELTLHIIEKENQLDAQNNKISALEEGQKELKFLIEEIKNKK